MADVPNAGSRPPAVAGRTETLASLFEELFTAIVRLRADRQPVLDAERFRGQVLSAIRAVEQNARAKGYTDVDIRLAVFAVAAFLDESILNLRKPAFNEWVRKPLQEELFGRHVAGEVFFENLAQLLGRRDAPETADLLEVYSLSMLLGYLGRYSIASKGDLKALMGQTEDKIRRIRNRDPHLSPQWNLPAETARRGGDPWIRRLAIAAAACTLFTLLIFGASNLSLTSGASGLNQLSLQGR